MRLENLDKKRILMVCDCKLRKLMQSVMLSPIFSELILDHITGGLIYFQIIM